MPRRGPYTIPAHGGGSNVLAGVPGSGYNSAWYGKNMYDPRHAVHTYHTRTFGHPKECGDKDLIPLFTAEQFDPEEWVEQRSPLRQWHDGRFNMGISGGLPVARPCRRRVVGGYGRSLSLRLNKGYDL